jgi:CheY-like chemotaxis protein
MATVLYVEDNDDNVYMLRGRLLRAGFGVVVACSESPDVILMDLDLPVLDGWQATRRLKSRPETQRIPVIALSAHAMEHDRAAALEAGCDDFDTKPVDFPRLLEKIRALVDRGSIP